MTTRQNSKFNGHKFVDTAGCATRSTSRLKKKHRMERFLSVCMQFGMETD